MMRSGLHQFLLAAVTVEHADGGHPVASRPDHVMASISDHDGVCRAFARLVEREVQEFGLIRADAVEFRSEYAFKVCGQFEVTDDALGIDAGFAGRDEQTVTGLA